MEDFDFVRGIGPNATRDVIRALIAEPATAVLQCCITGCCRPATFRRGSAVIFYFCETHNAALD